MIDAQSFDGIIECNLLEVFCDSLDAAIIVTDRLDQVAFASVRLLHIFSMPEDTIAPGNRARDLYAALFDAGCRFGVAEDARDTKKRDEWISERIAWSWRERADAIEHCRSDRWMRIISRRFASGLGLMVIQDVTEHSRKENQWKADQERIHLTEQILDRLPVAIAVKDADLDFAAVNQQFCRLFRTAAEAVIGRKGRAVFTPELAETFERIEGHLLATGEESQALVRFDNGEDETLLAYRVHRIGRPGQHFLVISFEELPAELPLLDTAAARIPASGHVAGENAAHSHEIPGGDAVPTRLRVILVAPRDGDHVHLKREAAAEGAEVTVVSDEREFDAFLPALKKAGLEVDAVLVAHGMPPGFASICTRHGIEPLMLTRDTPPLAVILGLLETPDMAAPEIAPVMPEAFGPDLEVQDIMHVDVLAIEDNDVNRLALEQILESLTLSCLVVPSGEAALAAVPRHRPRLILIDATLPDMALGDLVDGLENAFDAALPPLIAMVASGSERQREACQAAGIAHFVTKPLSPDALQAAMRSHLSTDGKSSRSAA